MRVLPGISGRRGVTATVRELGLVGLVTAMTLLVPQGPPVPARSEFLT